MNDMEIISTAIIITLVVTVMSLIGWVLHLKRKLYYTEEHNMRLLKELLDIRSSERQGVSIWE